MPMPPSYNRTSYMDGNLLRNPDGGYYGYSTTYLIAIPPGLCEAVLVSAAILLWFYSIYRLYYVWQNTLNFSEASIQGPRGWDLVMKWIVERRRLRMRLRKIKVLYDYLQILCFHCLYIHKYTPFAWVCLYIYVYIYI